jgi:hypothetical protein
MPGCRDLLRAVSPCDRSTFSRKCYERAARLFDHLLDQLAQSMTSGLPSWVLFAVTLVVVLLLIRVMAR